MAAVLGCGPEAMLSHGSAAALWGFGDEVGREIEVSIRTASDRRRPDIRIHRRPGIRADDRREHNRIPVTSPVRTLIDQAARLHPLALERSVNEADKLDLVDPEDCARRCRDIPESVEWGCCNRCSTGRCSGSATQIWRSPSG
jgi:hypothetical protein